MGSGAALGTKKCMTDQKDPTALARRFIDLGQDQVGAMLHDPEQISAIRPWSALGMQAGLVVPPAYGETRKREAGGDEKPDRPNRTATPPSGTPSGYQHAAMDELARRVQELGARLAALEPGTPANGSAPPGRPRQISSRRRSNR